MGGGRGWGAEEWGGWGLHRAGCQLLTITTTGLLPGGWPVATLISRTVKIRLYADDLGTDDPTKWDTEVMTTIIRGPFCFQTVFVSPARATFETSDKTRILLQDQ